MKTLIAVSLIFLSSILSLFWDINFARAAVNSVNDSSVETVPQTRSRRVGEIQESEREIVRMRVRSLKFSTVSLGPAAPEKLGERNMFYSLSLARNWEVNEKGEIRLSLHGASASKQAGGFAMVSMGGSYLSSIEEISPIFGGEFGFGGAKADGIESVFGFAGSVHGGVRFFRTAETQMSIEGFYRTIFSGNTPYLFGAQLSIHY